MLTQAFPLGGAARRVLDLAAASTWKVFAGSAKACDNRVTTIGIASALSGVSLFLVGGNNSQAVITAGA